MNKPNYKFQTTDKDNTTEYNKTISITSHIVSFVLFFSVLSILGAVGKNIYMKKMSKDIREQYKAELAAEYEEVKQMELAEKAERRKAVVQKGGSDSLSRYAAQQKEIDSAELFRQAAIKEKAKFAPAAAQEPAQAAPSKEEIIAQYNAALKANERAEAEAKAKQEAAKKKAQAEQKKKQAALAKQAGKSSSAAAKPPAQNKLRTSSMSKFK
jgi:hypothetical protein